MRGSRVLRLGGLAGVVLLVVSCVSATLLPDGRVLLVSVTGAKLFDPATGTLTDTGGPTSIRVANTWTQLPDGRLLAIGGTAAGGTVNATAEIYGPATGTFTEAGDLPVPYALHSALLLPDGRVLLAGGATEEGSSDLSTMEMYSGTYDPETGDYESVIDPPKGRFE